MNEKTVPAHSFCVTLFANIDNPHLTDEQFRDFVRNTASIVITEDPLAKPHTPPERSWPINDKPLKS